VSQTSIASKLDQTDPADKRNFFKEENGPWPHGADPPPPLLRLAKASRNHLKEEIITPLTPHWERRAIQPNHIKFRTSTVLAPM
jgi:hypothetical protein